jgi:hypothetical protein
MAPFDDWALNLLVYVCPKICLPAIVSPTLLKHSTGIQKQQFIALLADTPAEFTPVHIGATLHGCPHSLFLRPRFHLTSIMHKHYRWDGWLGDGPNRPGLTDRLHSTRIYRRDWRGKTGHVTHHTPDSEEVIVSSGLAALDGAAALHPASKPAHF